MKKFIIVYILVILLVVKYSSSEPIIQIGNSKVIGEKVSFKEYEVNQFLSVPYAKPPIGQLRFKKPEPVQSYPAQLYALKLPPSCPQSTNQPFAFIPNSTYKSEDCLYLNIWTPSDASPDNKKAVLYWIYGGGFRYGSVQLPVYSGIPLTALGDIIVVTVNYRVGPFGFLSSGTNDAPGNVGLWDILEGLKWVNKYIGHFGGDTSRITIAGESAGSWSVGLLSVSPLAKGLYQRQIMESGSPVFLAAEDNTLNLGLTQKLAEAVGCASPMFTVKENPGAVVECLKGVDAAVIARADYPLDPSGLPTFLYQYGDEILPENPRISILKGDFRCNEALIGTNHDEGSLVITAKFKEFFGFFGEKKPLFNKSVGGDLLRKLFKEFPDPETVVQHFLPDSLPESASSFIRYQTYTSFGDFFLLCPSVYYAEKCAEKGGDVNYFSFIHRPSNTPFAPWMGETHFEEVQFVFGSPLLNPSTYTQDEEGISRQMIEAWSSFVKNGKPSIPWPLYSKEVPHIKLLGPGIITGEDGIGPHIDSCNFFRPYVTSV